ncbi:hypothetical protein EVAR_67779_1 [Eumeta japonica]|uniref:Uncharacterized protein n=1 Tax=Eumeta variegata TaxID=151549 RepID=A0A4C1ZT22_EUMVA|nr:hypothetical protein EVAR_67779_1 [Eumeta japonica]
MSPPREPPPASGAAGGGATRARNVTQHVPRPPRKHTNKSRSRPRPRPRPSRPGIAGPARAPVRGRRGASYIIHCSLEHGFYIMFQFSILISFPARIWKCEFYNTIGISKHRPAANASHTSLHRRARRRFLRKCAGNCRKKQTSGGRVRESRHRYVITVTVSVRAPRPAPPPAGATLVRGVTDGRTRIPTLLFPNFKQYFLHFLLYPNLLLAIIRVDMEFICHHIIVTHSSFAKIPTEFGKRLKALRSLKTAHHRRPPQTGLALRLMMELEGGHRNSVIKRRNPIEFGLV